MRFDRNSRWLKLAVLLATLLLTMAACGEDEPVTPEGTDTEAGAEGGDFQTLEEGRLIVGSDIPYPPFEYEEGGQLTGFDVEVVRGVAERLGLENPDEDWISTDFGTIFEQLASNTKFDIVVAAVTGYAPEGSPASETVADRKEAVDFTEPYYPSLQSLTVDPAQQDAKTFEELPEGSRVGVQRATTGAFYAEENLAPLGLKLVSFEKAPQMYQQLQGGNLDAVFNDLPVSLDAIEKQFTDLEVVQQVETGEEYAIAVSKDNPELREAINGALQEMYEDGTYAEIFQKYFPEQKLPEYASE